MRRLSLLTVAALLMCLPMVGEGHSIKYHPGANVTVLAAAALDAATTGTGEEVLYTYSLPANTAGKDGDTLEFFFTAQAAANGNSKTIRFRVGGIGGTSLCGVAGTGNSTAISCRALCQRVSVSTMWCWTSGYIAASPQGSATSLTGLDLSAAISIVATGTTPTAAADVAIKSVFIAKIAQ